MKLPAPKRAPLAALIILGLVLVNGFLFLRLSWPVTMALAVLAGFAGYWLVDRTMALAALIAFLSSVAHGAAPFITADAVLDRSRAGAAGSAAAAPFDEARLPTLALGTDVAAAGLRVDAADPTRHRHGGARTGDRPFAFWVAPVVPVDWRPDRPVPLWAICLAQDRAACLKDWTAPTAFRVLAATRDWAFHRGISDAAKARGLVDHRHSRVVLARGDARLAAAPVGGRRDRLLRSRDFWNISMIIAGSALFVAAAVCLRLLDAPAGGAAAPDTGTLGAGGGGREDR